MDKNNVGIKNGISNPITADIERVKSAVDSSVIERLIAIAMERGGDFAEIYLEYSMQNAITLEENKIHLTQHGENLGVGIRVLSGEKTGYAYSDSLEFDDLQKAAKTASYIATNTGAERIVSLNATPDIPTNRSPLQSFPVNTPLKYKSDMLWRINNAAFNTDKRIIQTRAAITDSIKFCRIANSLGTYVDNLEPLCRISVYVMAEDNGQRQLGYYGAGGRVDFSFYDSLTPEDMAKEAVRIAIVRLSAREAPAGPQEVVLGNGWAGILLHEAVAHGLEADFNRKKTSLYSGRIGQKVASNLVTVIDDGTIPNRRGTINIDDEGAATRKNVLIENGILKGYLSDYLNARLMNTTTTGSGRRESYKHYPMPRMTNTFMAAGESTPEEIIKSIKKGLYAKSFGGGQVDISNGQFIFEVTEGYLIEEGKITAPVKGASLIGIGPKVLEKVVMVGNDFELDPGIGTCGKNDQHVPVTVGTPTCKISEITVGGTDINIAN